MFDVHAFGIAFRLAIMVMAIVLTIRYVLQPTLVETFRQRVFCLRRQLFLARLDGVVSADDPAYRMMMRQINGVLRFADAFSFGRILLHIVTSGHKVSAPDELDEQLANTNATAREALERFRVRLGYEMVRHMVLTSPLAWGFLIVLLPLKALRSVRVAVVGTGEKLGARPAVKRLEADAREMLPDDFARAA